MTTTHAPVSIRINRTAAAVHLSTQTDGRIDFPVCGAPGNTPRAYAAFRPFVVSDAPTCKRCLKLTAEEAPAAAPAAQAPTFTLPPSSTTTTVWTLIYQGRQATDLTFGTQADAVAYVQRAASQGANVADYQVASYSRAVAIGPVRIRADIELGA
jgi:hypothetical protein